MNDTTYSRVSIAAVVSAIAGGFTGIGLLAPPFAVFASAGVILGLIARRSIRRYEMAGRRLAKAGIASSLIFALLTPALLILQIRLETPAGYTRLDFYDLTKNSAEGLAEYVGQAICLKGFTHYPGDSKPRGTLLFSYDGDDMPQASIVTVELPPGETREWDHEALSISGTLERNPEATIDPSQPKFVLKQAIVRHCSTPYLLAGRSRRGC
jgi:hypothetical protein